MSVILGIVAGACALISTVGAILLAVWAHGRIDRLERTLHEHGIWE